MVLRAADLERLWCAIRYKAWAEVSATGQVSLEGYLRALDQACQDLRRRGLSPCQLAQVCLRAKESFLAAKGHVLPLDPMAVGTIRRQWRTWRHLVCVWVKLDLPSAATGPVAFHQARVSCEPLLYQRQCAPGALTEECPW